MTNSEYLKARQQYDSRIKLTDWDLTQRIDAHMQRGIEDGLSFDTFRGQTSCPEALRGRYAELKAEHDRIQARKNDDFLKGFMKEG